ncbi:hypothetical protein DY000_02040097 [Brassica cretica]|uniref:Uncharacterized protein n=1 Tax=Brassica cretica TaxID=69181 RepID=A0ABQ7BQ61_BRACR|nr:hypothetical protein DY000_02040097 [Brassica cretica]
MQSREVTVKWLREVMAMRSRVPMRLRMKAVLRGVPRVTILSGIFFVLFLPVHEAVIYLSEEMSRSSKAGFRARPRFTLGLRLCDDKSAFVLPVCDFNLIRTDIKSANCYRLIRLILIRIELPLKAVWRF